MFCTRKHLQSTCFYVSYKKTPPKHLFLCFIQENTSKAHVFMFHTRKHLQSTCSYVSYEKTPLKHMFSCNLKPRYVYPHNCIMYLYFSCVAYLPFIMLNMTEGVETLFLPRNDDGVSEFIFTENPIPFGNSIQHYAYVSHHYVIVPLHHRTMQLHHCTKSKCISGFHTRGGSQFLVNFSLLFSQEPPQSL